MGDVDVDRHRGPFVGGEDLLKWLKSEGFRITYNGLDSDENECNWYAYRPLSMPTKKCDPSNEQPCLLVKPCRYKYQYIKGGVVEDSVISTCGRTGGVWFELKSAGMTYGQVKENLDMVERSLISAWNAMSEYNEVLMGKNNEKTNTAGIS
jgi:hypothetical protein